MITKNQLKNAIPERELLEIINVINTTQNSLFVFLESIDCESLQVLACNKDANRNGISRYEILNLVYNEVRKVIPENMRLVIKL